MNPQVSSKTAWSLRHWAILGALLLILLGLVSYSKTFAHTAKAQTVAHAEHHCPIIVTVFSPDKGDTAGLAGAGFVIDLSLVRHIPLITRTSQLACKCHSDDRIQRAI